VPPVATQDKLLTQLFTDEGRCEVIAVPQKSCYDVVFLRDTRENKEYVLKGFQLYGKALRDFQKETRGHSLVSES